jgi:hypothetical protein
MIAVAKTIIDVRTMMIKFLNTFLAPHAMSGSIGFDDFAIKAEVFQIN